MHLILCHFQTGHILSRFFCSKLLLFFAPNSFLLPSKRSARLRTDQMVALRCAPTQFSDLSTVAAKLLPFLGGFSFSMLNLFVILIFFWFLFVSFFYILLVFCLFWVGFWMFSDWNFSFVHFLKLFLNWILLLLMMGLVVISFKIILMFFIAIIKNYKVYSWFYFFKFRTMW